MTLIFVYTFLFAAFSNVYGAPDWTEIITQKCFDEKLSDTSTLHHCFFSPNFGTYWTDAQKWCRDHNGFLAVISNPTIQNFVEGFVNFAGIPTYAWIGATLRMYGEGNWIWTDDAHYRDPHNIKIQSDSKDDDMTAVSIFVNDDSFQLTAHNPSDLLAHICQYPADSDYCKTSKSGYTLNDKCYVLHNGPTLQSWYDARISCLLDNGDLASFDGHLSQFHSTWLKSRYTNLSVWIGLRNSRWMWNTADGSKDVKFTNFGPNGLMSLTKRCLVLDYTNPWKWTNYDCSWKEPRFICQSQTVVDGENPRRHDPDIDYLMIFDNGVQDGIFPVLPPMSIGCIVVCLLSLLMLWLSLEFTFYSGETWRFIRDRLVESIKRSININRRARKPNESEHNYACAPQKGEAFVKVSNPNETVRKTLF